MDYLKQLASQKGGKITKQDLFSSNFKQKSFRKLIIKDFKHYRIYIDDFSTLCFIGIKVHTKVAFSINNPDAVLFFKSPIRVNYFQHTIYVSRTNDALANEEITETSKVFVQLLEKLSLTPEESIFISADTAGFALKTNRDLGLVLVDIIDMLQNNPNIFNRIVRKVINIQEIPEHLRVLAPLLKKYSIPDDAERGQLVESLRKKKRIQLIESVNPYMNEINSYLSSFGEQPLTEEATLIGNLAELVTELKIKSS